MCSSDLVVSSSAQLYPSASGSMGRAVPGHDVQIVDEEGEIYQVAKFALVGHLQGYPVPLIIETARAAINHHSQPTFAEVFDGLRGK